MWRYNVKFQKGLEYASLSCQTVFSVPSEPNTPVLPTSVSCLSYYVLRNEKSTQDNIYHEK